MSTRMFSRGLLLPLVVLMLCGCGNSGSKGTGGSMAGNVSTGTAAAAAASPGGGDSYSAFKISPADVRARTPDLVMDPTAWYKEFKADPRGMEKYRGQLIEVSGKLTRVRGDLYTHGFQLTAHFGVNFPENPYAAVGCDIQDEAEWSKLGLGQEVTVKGEYDPNSVFPHQMPFLGHAVVTKAGPETQLRYDSEKLAEEYAADPKKTVEKCQKRTLVVTGEIVEIGEEGVGSPCVDLKGKNGKFVRCFLDKPVLEKLKLKQGDKVKVLAVCDIQTLQRDQRIGLSQTHFMK